MGICPPGPIGSIRLNPKIVATFWAILEATIA